MRKILKISIILISILWLLFIIYNSTRNSIISSNQSNYIKGIINRYINLSSYQVRKLAHFIQYFILATILIVLLKDKYILVSLIVLLVASSDEFIQTFINGRSGSINDVIIDMFGCLYALGLILKIKERKIVWI